MDNSDGIVFFGAVFLAFAIAELVLVSLGRLALCGAVIVLVSAIMRLFLISLRSLRPYQDTNGAIHVLTVSGLMVALSSIAISERMAVLLWPNGSELLVSLALTGVVLTLPMSANLICE